MKLIILFFTYCFIFNSASQNLVQVQKLYSNIYQAELIAKKGFTDSSLVLFEKTIHNLDFIQSNKH